MSRSEELLPRLTRIYLHLQRMRDEAQSWSHEYSTRALGPRYFEVERSHPNYIASNALTHPSFSSPGMNNFRQSYQKRYREASTATTSEVFIARSNSPNLEHYHSQYSPSRVPQHLAYPQPTSIATPYHFQSPQSSQTYSRRADLDTPSSYDDNRYLAAAPNRTYWSNAKHTLQTNFDTSIQPEEFSPSQGSTGKRPRPLPSRTEIITLASSIDSRSMPTRTTPNANIIVRVNSADSHGPTIVCTCKKSKCLKLYCQCFNSSLMCNTSCRCNTCMNTPKDEKARNQAIQTILTRNPGAFQTKFIADGDLLVNNKYLKRRLGIFNGLPTVPPPSGSGINGGVAHKVGCKCRKSKCLKKYCECFQGNTKCGQNCRCTGCKNQLPLMDTARPRRKFSHGENPVMLDAARDLALLRHTDPSVKKLTTEVESPLPQPCLSKPKSATGANCSAKSDSISPMAVNAFTTTAVSLPVFSYSESGASGAVSSLLLAARAMTELGR